MNFAESDGCSDQVLQDFKIFVVESREFDVADAVSDSQSLPLSVFVD